MHYGIEMLDIRNVLELKIMCRFKDGQEVTADAHIKISRDSQSLEDYNLTVTVVKGADAGDYEARAENSLGTASTKSTVKVNSEYTYRFFCLQPLVVIFHCHIIHVPEMSYLLSCC
jgi:hypothetical protein